MKILFLLSVMLLFTSPLLKAGGRTGADFLNFHTDSRSASMAGAFTAVGGSAESLKYNPASAGAAMFNHASLMHNEAGEEITHQHASFMGPVGLRRGGVGLSASYFKVGGITGYTAGGEPTGKDVDSRSMSFSGTFGAPLTDSLYGGLSARVISAYLHEYSAHALAFDGGILWKTPREGLQLGASFTNLGGGLQFIEESSPLPLEFRAGSAYQFTLLGATVLTSVDGVFPQHYSPGVNFGTELSFLDFAFARAGYTTDDDLGTGLRLGGGVKTAGFSLDYAWLGRGSFDNSHRVSVAFRFGRKYGELKVEEEIRKHFERGQKLYNAGRLLEAYREFSLLSTLAPRHEGAAEYLSRIELRVEDAQVASLIEENLRAGREFYNRGRLARAIEKFETVLSLDSENEEAIQYLGRVRARFEEAAEALLDEAIQLYEEGNYEEALTQIERVLLLDETNRQALQYREMTQSRIRELEELRRQREEERQRQIRRMNITRALESGRANIERGRFSRAMDDFNRALELDDENTEAIEGYTSSGIKLTEELITKDDFMQGREIIEKVLRVSPDSEDALLLREEISDALREKASNLNRQALSLYASGRLQEAIQMWEEALQMYPDHEAARQNLNRARRELQE